MPRTHDTDSNTENVCQVALIVTHHASVAVLGDLESLVAQLLLPRTPVGTLYFVVEPLN